MSYGVGGTGSVPEADTVVAPVPGTRIYLKRSEIKGKQPAYADAEYGELFVNYHSDDPMLCFKDNGGNIVALKPAGPIGNGPTPPSSGNEIGDIWWDGNNLLVWNGSSWETVGEQALGDLTDVDTTGEADGMVLAYNGTTWVPVSPASLAVDVDLGYTAAADKGTVTNTAGDDAEIPLATDALAGLMAPGDKDKLDKYPADPTTNLVDLDYTAAADGGTVTNTGGTDASLPLANGTNAGLSLHNFSQADKDKLDAYPQDPNTIAPTVNLGYTAAADKGTVTNTAGTDAEIPLATDTSAGLMSPADFAKLESIEDHPISIGDIPPSTPNLGDLWVNTDQCPPVLSIWDDCDDPGNPTWTPVGGGGSRPINPEPDDVSASPAFVGGIGTQVDPFIISPATVGFVGGTARSEQAITLTGEVADLVIFTDNSVGAGTRFAQATGIIGAGGTWTGRLTYEDTPDTVTDTVYTGDLQIGTAYFRWVVTQETVPELVEDTPTVIAGKAEVGATLTATAGTATGGFPPITYATQWQVSADGTSGWSDIPGAIGLAYVIQEAELNQYIRAVTTARDSTSPIAQTLEMPSVSSAKVEGSPVVDVGWNANTDAYNRDAVADRNIDTHVGMRRCLVTDAGAVTYLDADDSTKLAGDWLRLCETTELNNAYTGTHGPEVVNTGLRAAAPAWAAGTFNKGQRVTHNGNVWECIAAATTATPAAGTAPATLNGSAGQVMVEVPRFSVLHETAAAGSYQQHTFHLTKGTKTDDGYSVHPAFVKPDNSYRDFFYIGAYQGTGTNGNGSASGVNNTTNMTRAACRTACAGRGAGWHQLGYWEYNALQWLLITEYQDMNSQRVLGHGSMEGATYVVNTGLSNVRGNRCGQVTGGSVADYVSYRGVENIYGRAWQWVDGFNANSTNVYLNNNPAQWADDTSTNYTANGSVPTSSGDYQRDVMNTVALLPSSVAGASGTTFIGDALWTSTGWLVVGVGGNAGNGARDGGLCLRLAFGSSHAYTDRGGRLAYAQ